MRLPALALLAVAAATPIQADDKQDVRAAIEAAYVQGVHAAFSADAMRRGFHPEFRMYVLKDGAATVVTRDEWIARLEQGAASAKAKPQIKAEYPMIEVAGNASVVRVELHRDGRHTFTDFLSLYRFADGWKIVAKTFQLHP